MRVFVILKISPNPFSKEGDKGYPTEKSNEPKFLKRQFQRHHPLKTLSVNGTGAVDPYHIEMIFRGITLMLIEMILWELTMILQHDFIPLTFRYY